MRLAVTRNLFDADGAPAFDFGLDLLESHPRITWHMLMDDVPELTSRMLEGFDAVIVEQPTRVTAASLDGNPQLRIVARFGVGYDNIDVGACTANGTAVTITPDGVRRPMAVAAVTLLLALSQHLLVRDRLTREGRWNERGNYLGVGLETRTVGLIGLGNIGKEVATLLAPFGCRLIASDPHVSASEAEASQVELLSLRAVLEQSDFLAVLCALTPETYHLIDSGAFAIIKPAAFLVNVARGPIVDQEALVRALIAGRLGGAGLDVFEEEPVDPSSPLFELPNVIVTGHSLGWTDQCMRDTGLSAIQSVVDAGEGRVPASLLNRDVLAHANWLGAQPSKS